MKNFKQFILILIIALSITACEKVTPGNVGIEVDLYGDDKGVQDLVLFTGMNWYNPLTTDILSYPTYVQTVSWTKDSRKDANGEATDPNQHFSFNSENGMVFTSDVSLSYELIKEKVPEFYVKFRTDDLDDFTDGYMRNVARDAFNNLAVKYSVEQIYGVDKDKLLQEVKAYIQEQVKPFGVNIVQFGYIGEMGLPPAVKKALNDKIKANQIADQKENEKRQEQADAAKLVAKAEGIADSNKKIHASITPEMIQWRKLDLYTEWLAKWDGKLPHYMMGGSNGGVMPVMNINPDKK